MPTGLVYNARFLDHDTGPGHPERPDRLRTIVERLQKESLWDDSQPISPRPAEAKWVEKVHNAAYLHRFRVACETGQPYIDTPDSAICPASYEIARLAAGGVLAACDEVMSGRVRNAFCAIRPPGHHAERDRSMGFCLLNNIAIAAEYLLAHHRIERVAIVDFDVHHGNGTQHHFESRKDVLFISLHEHPNYQYPGTGFEWEAGEGEGKGFTINIPLQPGSGDEAYRQAFRSQVLPALDGFAPQFLLLSAGFDASEHDPLGHMKVTAEGFEWMTRQLKAAAERHCGGRVVSVLEGGYDLKSLGECVVRHVGELMKVGSRNSEF